MSNKYSTVNEINSYNSIFAYLNKQSPCKNEDNHAVEDQSCKTQQRQNDSIDGLHHVNWTEPVRHIYLIAIVI